MKRTSLTLLLLLCACGAPELTFTERVVSELSSTRARVAFLTSRPASCEIELGTSPELLDQHFSDPDMMPGQRSLTHTVPLENLSPSTRYHLRAVAVDGAGVTYRSTITSFQTLEGGQAMGLNVALASEGSTIAEVSSNFGGGGNDSTFGALKAIDGNFATEWSTHGDGDAARVTIDLGQARTLTRFGFRSRSMTDGSSIITRVGLSLDGAAVVAFDTPDPRELYVFNLAAPTQATRATITAITSTGGNTGAREIQLLTAAP